MAEIPLHRSETSKHRDVVAPFCTGYGLDIGFGGDAVTPSAIRMDFPFPYTKTGDLPVQLGGDCRNLKWLASDQLDYVYSSHVLEDFDREETEPVLREWLRVVKPGGRVVLLLPDQRRYIRFCVKDGQVSPDGVIGNPHHSIEDFSLDYVLEVARRIGGNEKETAIEALGDYSFLLVLKKLAPSGVDSDRVAELEKKIEAAWKERDDLKWELLQKDRQLRQQNLLRSLLRKVKGRLFPPREE